MEMVNERYNCLKTIFICKKKEANKVGDKIFLVNEEMSYMKAKIVASYEKHETQ